MSYEYISYGRDEGTQNVPEEEEGEFDAYESDFDKYHEEIYDGGELW